MTHSDPPKRKYSPKIWISKNSRRRAATILKDVTSGWFKQWFDRDRHKIWHNDARVQSEPNWWKFVDFLKFTMADTVI